MTTLETGKNLHTWLLKMILACSKKYTMTYYCRFQCGNCVIMPIGHECSCCCEVERVSEDHVSPRRVVLGPNVPCQDMMSPLPPTTTAAFLAIESWAWGLRTRLAAFSKALLRTLMQRISLVPRPHPKIGERAWSQLAKIPVCAVSAVFVWSRGIMFVHCQLTTFLTREGSRLVPRPLKNGNKASRLLVNLEFQKLYAC